MVDDSRAKSNYVFSVALYIRYANLLKIKWMTWNPNNVPLRRLILLNHRRNIHTDDVKNRYDTRLGRGSSIDFISLYS